MEFIIHSANPDIVLVTLERQVVGGPQATEFSGILHDIANKGGRCVVVNFSDVELMNSSGLGMLVSGLTSMRKYGGTIKLIGVSEKVEGLLKITRLNTVFESFSSFDEAVESWETK